MLLINSDSPSWPVRLGCSARWCGHAVLLLCALPSLCVLLLCPPPSSSLLYVHLIPATAGCQYAPYLLHHPLRLPSAALPIPCTPLTVGLQHLTQPHCSLADTLYAALQYWSCLDLGAYALSKSDPVLKEPLLRSFENVAEEMHRAQGYVPDVPEHIHQGSSVSHPHAISMRGRIKSYHLAAEVCTILHLFGLHLE